MAYYRKLLTVIFERRRRLAERLQQQNRRGNRQEGAPAVPLSHEGRGQVVSEARGRVVKVFMDWNRRDSISRAHVSKSLPVAVENFS